MSGKPRRLTSFNLTRLSGNGFADTDTAIVNQEGIGLFSRFASQSIVDDRDYFKASTLFRSIEVE